MRERESSSGKSKTLSLVNTKDKSGTQAGRPVRHRECGTAVVFCGTGKELDSVLYCPTCLKRVERDDLDVPASTALSVVRI